MLVAVAHARAAGGSEQLIPPPVPFLLITPHPDAGFARTLLALLFGGFLNLVLRAHNRKSGPLKGLIAGLSPFKRRLRGLKGFMVYGLGVVDIVLGF